MSEDFDQVDAFLGALWDRKGSDLLLTAGAPPMVRVDGLLTRLEDQASLRPGDTERFVRALMNDKQSLEFERRRELDFSFNWRDQARVRASAFTQRGSVAVAMRLIRYDLPSFTDLGLPDVLARYATLPQGLVLVTGPTGSGKSTTLASMINEINTSRACHIITIEDPIEYVHRHKMAAVNQRQVGEDTDTFASALRSALREDPDVLLIGEMRDLETIQTALTVAETGHLVFATLHTNDTAQALDRIVDVFPAEQQTQIRVQLANSLTAIVYQRLLPRVGGGRVAAYEVLVANHAVRNLIREGKTRQIRNIVVTGQKEGMQTLEASLSDLVAQGKVAHEVAVAFASYPNEVRKPA
ncbi:MAG: twitching motility protein PilT [Frankiaceae bacterium]|jgi:twitching motility protein PilT|nr:twitching motility protein PilT [Frankiaceae bacterium]